MAAISSVYLFNSMIQYFKPILISTVQTLLHAILFDSLSLLYTNFAEVIRSNIAFGISLQFYTLIFFILCTLVNYIHIIKSITAFNQKMISLCLFSTFIFFWCMESDPGFIKTWIFLCSVTLAYFLRKVIEKIIP